MSVLPPACLRQSVVCPTLCFRQRCLLNLALALQVELCLSYLLLASGRVFSFPTLCLRQRCLLHLTLQFRQNYVLPPSPTTSLIEFCLSCAPGTDVCFAVCPSSGRILSILCMQSLVCPTSCPQSVCSALSLSCLQLPLKIGIIMSVPPVPFSSSFVCPALCLRDVYSASIQVELCLFYVWPPQIEFSLSYLVFHRCLICLRALIQVEFCLSYLLPPLGSVAFVLYCTSGRDVCPILCLMQVDLCQSYLVPHEARCLICLIPQFRQNYASLVSYNWQSCICPTLYLTQVEMSMLPLASARQICVSYLVPHPGRDVCCLLPQPGRAVSDLPCTSPRQRCLCFLLPQPGRAVSVLPCTSLRQRCLCCLLPQPGRAVSVLPYTSLRQRCLLPLALARQSCVCPTLYLTQAQFRLFYLLLAKIIIGVRQFDLEI